nr:MAG TPA: DNA methylase [Caudoviricetes sp.]
MAWEYGEVYKKYDMGGIINIGTGTVKVHDIFNPLPDYMKNADVIFSDPPCSEGNLKTFYTKADLEKLKFFEDFQKRFFECVDEIKPKTLFLEVFANNKNSFYNECLKRFKQVIVLDSYYYHNKKNKCWVYYCCDEINPKIVELLNNRDEQKIIELICKDYNFECIGDLCMGRGLVGYYANKYNRKFVGTELNQKRLAVLIDRINNGKL